MTCDEGSRKLTIIVVYHILHMISSAIMCFAYCIGMHQNPSVRSDNTTDHGRAFDSPD